MLKRQFQIRKQPICIGGESRAQAQKIRQVMHEHLDDYFDHLANGKQDKARGSLAACNDEAKSLVTLFDGGFVDG